MSKSRFSEPFEVDRAKLFVDPIRFQGRQGEYSEDTVNAIVQQGFAAPEMKPKDIAIMVVTTVFTTIIIFFTERYLHKKYENEQ